MSELTITSTTDSADDVREAVSQVAEVEQEEIDGASGTEASGETSAQQLAAEEPPPRKSGFQKRVDALTKKNYDLLERIKQLESARPTTPTNENTPRKVESLQELASRLERETAQLQPRQEQQRQPETRTQQPEVQQQRPSVELEVLKASYNQKERVAQEKYEDWQEVVGKCKLRVPDPIAEKIMGLENAADVTYFLASHPEQIMELIKGGPEMSFVQLGRISARLEKQESVAQRPRSNAPPPINGVRGTHATAPDLADENLSYSDYKRLREPQEKRWKSGVSR